MTTHQLLIGTYTRDASNGIYHATLDAKSGLLTLGGLAAKTESPAFLTQFRNTIYTVNELDPGRVSAFRLREGNLEFLNSVSSGGTFPCHLLATENWLAVANYSSGSVATFALDTNGTIGNRVDFAQHQGGGPNPQRQTGPKAHQTFLTTSGDLLVPDLGNDRLYKYRPDATGTFSQDPKITQLSAGVGPRHVDQHPNLPVLYVINELANTINVIRWENNVQARIQQSVSTLPADFDSISHTAEIAVAPDGRHVYGSNRGADTIVTFSVDDAGNLLVPGHVPTLGKHPRHFSIDPSDNWLLIANQASNNVVVYGLEDGRPINAVCEIFAPTPVCLHFVDA